MEVAEGLGPLGPLCKVGFGLEPEFRDAAIYGLVRIMSAEGLLTT